MAKITVCDLCKAKGKLTETNRYMKVKGRADLRLDYCPACKDLIPQKMVDYVKLVYSVSGVTLSDEEAKKMALR